MTKVLVVGYLAILDRLVVDRLPNGDGGGAVGRRSVPSLTCDAVLVGMHLWEAGVPTKLLASHPGSAHPHTENALFFLRERLAAVQVGPDLGSPFELETTGTNATRMWLNDPRCGVESLTQVPDVAEFGADCGIVYADVYPWLADASFTVCGQLAAGPDRVLYLNLGCTSLPDAERELRRWVDLWPATDVMIQVSLPGLGSAPAREAALSRLSALGVRYAVVTAAAAGLGIIFDREGTWVQSHPVETVVDSSGAGAAVSATMIRGLCSSDNLAVERLAHDSAIAGAIQCEVDGGLSARARSEWVALCGFN